MSDVEEFWRGAFGDEYTGRNRVYWPVRRPFWKHILDLTQADEILEVGCNAGWNLLALRAESESLGLTGVDLNMSALSEGHRHGLDVWNVSAKAVGAWRPEAFDLVFTCGVLIHVPGDELHGTMTSIVQASRKHVLAIEYESQTEEEIEYRGHADRLWKRPFGSLYKEHGLQMIETGDPGEGFDRCTYWLMEKQ